MADMHRHSIPILATAMVVVAACAQEQPASNVAAKKPAAPIAACVPGGSGALHAQLRGALVADIHWADAVMQCEGDARPDGKGLRLTIAGPLPGSIVGQSPLPAGAAPHQLRFIFGVDLTDSAAGAAQALPTNLTVIVEGEQLLFATRGADKCAAETLQRTPVTSSAGKLDQVRVRGYCTAPASNLDGDARLLVPTFDFTGVVRNEARP